MSARTPEINRLLTEWSALAGLADLVDATVTELPGGTARRSFVIEAAGAVMVLRLPRPGASSSLAAEATAVRAAAAAGVGPPLLVESPGGLLIAHQPGRALEPADVHDPAVRQRLCQALSRLHEVPPPLARLDLNGWTEAYRGALAQSGVAEPAGYAELLAELVPLGRALAATGEPSVAAHGDAVPDNFVDDGERVHVIDLEYAVQAEPWFDLAMLVDAADPGAQSPVLATDLVADYCQASGSVPGASDSLVARVQAWRLVARAAWLPWALLPAQRAEARAERWRDWPALLDLVRTDLPGLAARVAG